MPKKRRNIAVSLSFLDIMACGFGAVTLLFLILRHNATEVITPDIRISAEVDMLQMDIRDAEEEKVQLLNSLEKIKLELVEAQGLSKRVITDLEEQEKSIQNDPNDLDKLRRQVEQLEDETAQMEEVEFGDKVREVSGRWQPPVSNRLKTGWRASTYSGGWLRQHACRHSGQCGAPTQYGRRAKKQSPKVAVDIAHIGMAAGPAAPSSRFQVYIFNTEIQTAVPGTEGRMAGCRRRSGPGAAQLVIREYSQAQAPA